VRDKGRERHRDRGEVRVCVQVRHHERNGWKLYLWTVFRSKNSFKADMMFGCVTSLPLIEKRVAGFGAAEEEEEALARVSTAVRTPNSGSGTGTSGPARERGICGGGGRLEAEVVSLEAVSALASELLSRSVACLRHLSTSAINFVRI
jgi:hypothetical protein